MFASSHSRLYRLGIRLDDDRSAAGVDDTVLFVLSLCSSTSPVHACAPSGSCVTRRQQSTAVLDNQLSLHCRRVATLIVHLSGEALHGSCLVVWVTFITQGKRPTSSVSRPVQCPAPHPGLGCSSHRLTAGWLAGWLPPHVSRIAGGSCR